MNLGFTSELWWELGRGESVVASCCLDPVLRQSQAWWPPYRPVHPRWPSRRQREEVQGGSCSCSALLDSSRGKQSPSPASQPPPWVHLFFSFVDIHFRLLAGGLQMGSFRLHERQSGSQTIPSSAFPPVLWPKVWKCLLSEGRRSFIFCFSKHIVRAGHRQTRSEPGHADIYKSQWGAS